ncbi:MAG: aspartyl/asparaginyl beta-hydroxylase domain-containing protein [Gammaproteobacteria bacterium]|nr:MAG: aspartyl/asparaginyl beta-hydroxylase domain-containing protein [Gammaproteobacteria bacterium]
MDRVNRLKSDFESCRIRGDQLDIGVAYRELAKINVSALQAELLALTDVDWMARPIRRASLAGGEHCGADSIVMRHEWVRSYSKRGFKTLQESLMDWARRNKRDGRPMLPVMEERNSEASVFTFPDWFRWQARVCPIVAKALESIATPSGVLTRALFVRLPPGAVINPHMDGQTMATRAHRIHVAISDCPECVYTIGDTSFSMTPGVAYDFNNRWQHAVHNRGDVPRINLMLEYLPDPAWVFPLPLMLQPFGFPASAPTEAAGPGHDSAASN